MTAPEIDLDQLYNICEAVHLTHKKIFSTNGSLNRDPLAVYLKNYDKILGGTEWLDHKHIFLTIYKQNRELVLQTIDSSKWLMGDIVAWFGGDDPAQRRLNVKLTISAFYKKALAIKDALDKTLKTEDERLENNDYWMHDILLYRLLKVFHRAIDASEFDSDQPTIGTIMGEIANRASIDENAVVEAVRAPTDTNNPFASIILGLTPMLEGMGIVSPDGRPLSELVSGLDAAAVMQQVTGAMQNPEIMQSIGGRMGGLFQQVQSGENVDPMSVMNSMREAAIEVVSAAPPPGIVGEDTRTEEEKRAALEYIDKGFNQAVGMINSFSAPK